jgi:hypothetical protein
MVSIVERPDLDPLMGIDSSKQETGFSTIEPHEDVCIVR